MIFARQYIIYTVFFIWTIFVNDIKEDNQFSGCCKDYSNKEKVKWMNVVLKIILTVLILFSSPCHRT